VRRDGREEAVSGVCAPVAILADESEVPHRVAKLDVGVRVGHRSVNLRHSEGAGDDSLAGELEPARRVIALLYEMQLGLGHQAAFHRQFPRVVVSIVTLTPSEARAMQRERQWL
jgi:hypothetical protein